MKSYLLILSTIILFACSKGAQKVEKPCMTAKVNVFSENIICTSGAFVKEYEFQGECVYVFNHGDCISDHTETVVGYHCDTLGYLGGLAGSNEINGKNFYKKAELLRVLFSQ